MLCEQGPLHNLLQAMRACKLKDDNQVLESSFERVLSYVP